MSNDSINASERTASQWRNIKPEAVAAGSPAQVLYCIRDAQHDIVEALNEIDRLRAVIAEKDADIAHYVNRSQNMRSTSTTPSMRLSAIKMAHANRPDAHVFLRDLERAFSLGHQFGIERSAEVVDRCNKTGLYILNVAARIRALKVETARPVATLDSNFL